MEGNYCYECDIFEYHIAENCFYCGNKYNEMGEEKFYANKDYIKNSGQVNMLDR